MSSPRGWKAFDIGAKRSQKKTNKSKCKDIKPDSYLANNRKKWNYGRLTRRCKKFRLFICLCRAHSNKFVRLIHVQSPFRPVLELFFKFVLTSFRSHIRSALTCLRRRDSARNSIIYDSLSQQVAPRELYSSRARLLISSFGERRNIHDLTSRHMHRVSARQNQLEKWKFVLEPGTVNNRERGKATTMKLKLVWGIFLVFCFALMSRRHTKFQRDHHGFSNSLEALFSCLCVFRSRNDGSPEHGRTCDNFLLPTP